MRDWREINAQAFASRGRKIIFAPVFINLGQNFCGVMRRLRYSPRTIGAVCDFLDIFFAVRYFHKDADIFANLEKATKLMLLKFSFNLGMLETGRVI